MTLVPRGWLAREHPHQDWNDDHYLLREQSLLTKGFPDDGGPVRICKSDLTEDGLLFMKSHFQLWMRYLDKSGKLQ